MLPRVLLAAKLFEFPMGSEQPAGSETLFKTLYGSHALVFSIKQATSVQSNTTEVHTKAFILSLSCHGNRVHVVFTFTFCTTFLTLKNRECKKDVP